MYNLGDLLDIYHLASMAEIEDLEDEIKRLKKINAELLAACQLAECQHIGCGGQLKPTEVVRAMREILKEATANAQPQGNE